jgi:hypothetical protein
MHLSNIGGTTLVTNNETWVEPINPPFTAPGTQQQSGHGRGEKDKDDGKEGLIKGKRLLRLVISNILLAVAAGSLFFISVAWGRYEYVDAAANVDHLLLLDLFMSTLLTMMAVGALGGMLCNLRGLFQNIVEKNGGFPEMLVLPFYTRPFVGAITGMIVFFIGTLLTNALSIESTNLGWTSLIGRIPYIALALLAGFASREFMERMKEVVRTMFYEEKQNNESGSIGAQDTASTSNSASATSSSTSDKQT